MSALRFVAGAGAGAAIVALVLGASSVGPDASEPDAATVARVEAKPAAASGPGSRAAPAKKPSVQPGVLARAASRRAKPADGAASAAGAPAGTAAAPAAAAAAGADAPSHAAEGQKDAVIQSVEVDWGAPPARP